MSETVHASAVLVGAQGVLIRGPSGSGKSMLAAALIDRGARLIADDRVHLSACHGRIMATAPAAIAGMVELRGRGILSVPAERSAIIWLVVDLVSEDGLERMPENAQFSATILGVAVPRQPAPLVSARSLGLVEAALRPFMLPRNIGLRSTPVWG